MKSEYRKEAYAVTGVVMTVLILFFLFRVFTSVPELEVNEGGVEVQLGEPDQGGPDNKPITEQAYVPPTEASDDNVVSADESDVSVKTSDSKKQETKKPVEKVEPKKKVDQTITDLMNKKKN